MERRSFAIPQRALADEQDGAGWRSASHIERAADDRAFDWNRLTRHMAARFTDGGQRTLADRFLRESHDAAFRAQLIRRAISENGVAERGG